MITITDAAGGTTTAELKNGKEGNPGQNATDEQVRGAVDAYMAEHPVQVDTDDLIKIAIKNEASGAVPVVIADSAEMGVQDIKMQGWTEQDGTPTPEAPVPIVSAGKYNEETQKYEYWVKLTGANLFDITKVITYSGLLTNNGDGTLTVTPNPGSAGVCGEVPNTLRDFCPELISGKTYHLSADTTGTMKYIYLLGTNIVWYFGRQRTITDTDLESTVYFYASGINTEAVISDIMITEVEGADYEPYRLPQTVLLTSDRPLTKWDKLEKRNGVWGWEYGSAEIVFDGSDDEAWIRYNNANGGFYVYMINTGLKNGEFYINNFQYTPNNDYMVDGSAFFRSVYYGHNVLAIRYDSADDVDSFKSFLKQNNIIFCAQTVSETFVPLSESEQEQMNALHTYYPTTVLSNDTECEMSIKYIADTKTYIDSKIAAIQAAVVNTV